MKILISESQIKKLLNEIDLSNTDELIDYADYLMVMKTSMQKKISYFLELIKESGLVNMFESDQFLFMTKEHFDAMINYLKFKNNFDDETLEIIEKISTEIEGVRNLIISASVHYLDNKKNELTTKNLNNTIRKIISTTLRSWMQGILKRD
jgi:predicted protein tyrosine phosphatase